MSLFSPWKLASYFFGTNDNSSGCPAIDQLIESSKTLENGKPVSEAYHLKWISCSELSGVESIDHFTEPVYIASYKQTDNYTSSKRIESVILLGINDDVTEQEFISHEFARLYSLPTHVHDNPPHADKFKRYSKWVKRRNELIYGFTNYKGAIYLVAKRQMYLYYSLYGFCSACGILRCSPVWCICGHKEVSNTWTSENEELDEFIKKSQRQTKSANAAYLEWIPLDYVKVEDDSTGYLSGLLTYFDVDLIPLDIWGETDDSYYHKLCEAYPDILDTSTWITIGFTYDEEEQEYYLIRTCNGDELCLACAYLLDREIRAFCLACKAPRLRDLTTGNKSLDSFITQSWSKITKKVESHYIQWIEYSRLTDVRETRSLDYECTHEANWLEPTANKDVSVKVMLKKIAETHGDDSQSFDFYQLTKEYPNILTPSNLWIIAITQEPSVQDYYLVFYRDIHSMLTRLIRIKNTHSNHKIKFMPYEDFDEIKEIGSGGYGTVFTAKYKKNSEDVPERVVLKQFKNYDGKSELFISEFKIHANCSWTKFLKLYGVTQQRETKEYMVVIQYANNGSLSSYLEKNINTLTWKMKLQCLDDIAQRLNDMHSMHLIHCDLHGGNIVLNKNDSTQTSELFICDLGLSKPVDSFETMQNVQGVLSYIAPEVFHTSKLTKQSDIYAFGIIIHQIASGEPPFRNRKFDEYLARDICNGLRPMMPDTAPEAYKKLAERCCDADPDKRPAAWELAVQIVNLIAEVEKDGSDDNVWNTIYYNNNLRPLSRIENDGKYSSRLLPTANLPQLGNSYDIDAVSDSKQFDLVIPEVMTRDFGTD